MPAPSVPLDLLPLDAGPLRALVADAATLAPLCSNAAEIAEIVREVAEGTLAMTQARPAEPPWIGYLARREADRAIVGTCAFKGPPADGAVEIAYFTFPGHEGQGVATAMAGALVAIASGQAGVEAIVAHTLPRENASTRILRRCGFAFQDAVIDPEDGEVWRWSLSRPAAGCGGA